MSLFARHQGPTGATQRPGAGGRGWGLREMKQACLIEVADAALLHPVASRNVGQHPIQSHANVKPGGRGPTVAGCTELQATGLRDPCGAGSRQDQRGTSTPWPVMVVETVSQERRLPSSPQGGTFS